MGRWLITSIIVIICFYFLLFADVIPDYIIKLLPLEVWEWLLIISIVVMFLANIFVLPLSPKKK